MDTGKSRRKPSGTMRAWFLERISRRALLGQEGTYQYPGQLPEKLRNGIIPNLSLFMVYDFSV